MTEKMSIKKPANLTWWEYIAAAFETIHLIWKYGVDGAGKHVDQMRIEQKQKLNRLKYKP